MSRQIHPNRNPSNTIQSHPISSHHPILQTRQTRAKMLKIWKWYKWWHHKRQRIFSCIKNDKCFYSMEPYDKKVNKGPYFYHIQDEKTVFEFDPCLLSTYIDTAKNRLNPFSKVPFLEYELIRIDRLARRKNPRQKPLDIQTLMNPPSDNFERMGDGNDVMSVLHQMHTMLAGANLTFANSFLTNRNDTHQNIQTLFQQDPSSMIMFLQDQVSIEEEKRDQHWVQFMTALTGLVARRFDRVNNGSDGSGMGDGRRQIRIGMPSRNIFETSVFL